MGSLASEADTNQKCWNVLVTGFGPFLDNNVNPSYLIAASLPDAHNLPERPSIHITTYKHPIEVCYSSVRQLIPKLLFDTGTPTVDGAATSQVLSSGTPPAGSLKANDRPKYDIVLCLGLAPGRTHFSIESIAHRDGYAKKDIRGKSFEDDGGWRDAYNAPAVLQPSFDVLNVAQRWKEAEDMKGEDLRLSNNAGRYLCEFIFYATMLEYWRKNPAEDNRQCMFLHVPPGCNQVEIARGRDVVLALITAMVCSQTLRRRGQRTAKVGETARVMVMSDNDGSSLMQI